MSFERDEEFERAVIAEGRRNAAIGRAWAHVSNIVGWIGCLGILGGAFIGLVWLALIILGVR